MQTATLIMLSVTSSKRDVGRMRQLMTLPHECSMAASDDPVTNHFNQCPEAAVLGCGYCPQEKYHHLLELQ